MSKPRSKVLPLLPLPKGTVLLPGTSIRIPVVDRADVAALLANIYSRALTPSANAPITVGCIPLNSPLLSADGKRLIEGREGRDGDKFDVEPGQATKKDLFQYGTVAKVSGVQGRRQGELALIVEGLGRISITRIIQEKPYFEAELAHHEEKSKRRAYVRYARTRLTCTQRSPPPTTAARSSSPASSSCRVNFSRWSDSRPYSPDRPRRPRCRQCWRAGWS